MACQDPRCSWMRDADASWRQASAVAAPSSTPPEVGRHLLRRSCGCGPFRQGEAAKPSIQAGRPDRAEDGYPGGGRAPWASLGLAENGRWTEAAHVVLWRVAREEVPPPDEAVFLAQVEQAIATMPRDVDVELREILERHQRPVMCAYMGVNRQPILTPYRRAILTPLRCGNQGLSRRS